VKVNLCATIPAPTVDQALDLIKKAEQRDANLVELRFDYLDDLSLTGEIISATRLAKIATLRPVSKGGRFRGKEHDRIRCLFEAAKSGCEFIDIELGTKNTPEIIRNIKNLGAKTIISYHDFHSTPNLRKLNMILGRQIKTKADLFKIVTTAKRLRDNLTILDFVAKAIERGEVVSFAMGELGTVSRILSPIYGSSFTFGAVERGIESAAGQLTLEEMRNIYRLMRLE
jgi:3-dehydroquinate dehydratase type I